MRNLYAAIASLFSSLITLIAVVFFFRYLFYPYNYLLALSHALYKGEPTFSTKGEFMSYAFKGKYGLISFLFFITCFLIFRQTELVFPLIILCGLFLVFGMVVWLPLPKRLRTIAYPKPKWYSYIWVLIIPIVILIVLLAES